MDSFYLSALVIFLLGLTSLSVGIFLTNLVALFQSGIPPQATTHLPDPRQLLPYLRKPKQLKKDGPMFFLFVGASLILIAAVIAITRIALG